MFDNNQQQGAQDWQQQATQPIADDGIQPATPQMPPTQDFAPAPEHVAEPVQPDWSNPPAPAVQSDWSTPAPMVNDAAVPAVAEDTSNDDSGDLMDIKQKALNELSPLVSHLEQTPEEKFKTTMMMIQASDNQALISEAYEAAQAITDEKAKAQALLDIINEINYFTQHQS